MRPSGPWGENLAMEIRQVRFSDPEVESLLVGLSDEYDTRYGENIEMTRASVAEFDPPAGLFIVLMDGPTTAAGGGFRRFNESTCEVKRMWTSPLYRRRGLATRVLQSLQDAAWEIGYAYLILETGPVNRRPRLSMQVADTLESRPTVTIPRLMLSASISLVVDLAQVSPIAGSATPTAFAADVGNRGRRTPDKSRPLPGGPARGTQSLRCLLRSR